MRIWILAREARGRHLRSVGRKMEIIECDVKVKVALKLSKSKSLLLSKISLGSCEVVVAYVEDGVYTSQFVIDHST